MKKVKFQDAPDQTNWTYSRQEYDRSTIAIDDMTEEDYKALDQFKLEFHAFTFYNMEVTKSWRYSPQYYKAQSFLYTQIQNQIQQSLCKPKANSVNSTKWNLHAPVFIPAK